MPTLADLREIWSTDSKPVFNTELSSQSEEMVTDTRAHLSPSQQVEQKLNGALRNNQFASHRVGTTRQAFKPR